MHLHFIFGSIILHQHHNHYNHQYTLLHTLLQYYDDFTCSVCLPSVRSLGSGAGFIGQIGFLVVVGSFVGVVVGVGGIVVVVGGKGHMLGKVRSGLFANS